jgi:hypothetical protein
MAFHALLEFRDAGKPPVLVKKVTVLAYHSHSLAMAGMTELDRLAFLRVKQSRVYDPTNDKGNYQAHNKENPSIPRVLVRLSRILIHGSLFLVSAQQPAVSKRLV